MRARKETDIVSEGLCVSIESMLCEDNRSLELWSNVPHETLEEKRLSRKKERNYGILLESLENSLVSSVEEDGLPALEVFIVEEVSEKEEYIVSGKIREREREYLRRKVRLELKLK